MRIFNFVALAMLAVLFFLSACEERVEELNTSPGNVSTSPRFSNPSSTLIEDEVRDGLAEQVARNLASGLSDIEVRRFVKETAMEQFDGDYNFLIELSKDQSMMESSNGRARSVSFGEILSGRVYDPSGRSTGDTEAFLDSLSRLCPLLQVAVPELEAVDVESWDIAANPPLVAYLPSDYDDTDNNAVIPAYDAEGNYHELSNAVEPDQLTVVISENERLIAISTEEWEQYNANGRAANFPIPPVCSRSPFHQTSYNVILRRICIQMNALSTSSSSGSGSSSSNSGGCDRSTNNNDDHINKAHFKSIDVIRSVEGWPAGKPEVRLFVYGVRRNGIAIELANYAMGKDWTKRKRVLGLRIGRRQLVTKNFDHQIVNWDPNRYGDRMNYVWIEEDPSLVRVNINVRVSSTFNVLNTQVANVTVSGTAQARIGGADDVIADNRTGLVKYCDNTDGEGTRYSTPMIYWVNQQ